MFEMMPYWGSLTLAAFGFLTGLFSLAGSADQPFARVFRLAASGFSGAGLLLFVGRWAALAGEAVPGLLPVVLPPFAGLAAGLAEHAFLMEGGPARETLRRWSEPRRRREAYGSAHFCTPAEFARLQKPKGDHDLRLLGAFYGRRGAGDKPGRFYRLDRGPGRTNSLPGLCLGIEEQARGLSFIGPPGSGKSQSGILPVCADAMASGQSLIVLDPQGELGPHIEAFARRGGHRVVIHDPTEPDLPHFNLAADLRGVGDAQAVAAVLCGPGDFWTQAARNLLAACLLRFGGLGASLRSFDDLGALADRLGGSDDGAADLARSFVASVRAGDRSAPGVLATLQASTLGAWADPAVRAATDRSDFNAELLVEEPAVVVLRCPGRYRSVYGPYLGAVLQRLLLDLDTLAEGQPGGALPRPVKVVIDEFPLMGRLDAVLNGVNTFRKRRISTVIAAQSVAQLDAIYGRSGSETLLSGMATQVYFGACDAATARFVSAMLGRSTETSPTGPAGLPTQARGRDLMSVDEVASPPVGNCTIVARLTTATYAAQVVLLAALTPMYQRAGAAQGGDGKASYTELFEGPFVNRNPQEGQPVNVYHAVQKALPDLDAGDSY